MNRILRASAWLDDGNMVKVEVVAWNEEAGTKVAAVFAFTPEGAADWAAKLHHEAMTGLKHAPRPGPPTAIEG